MGNQRSGPKVITIVFAAFGVFALGVGVGNGKISVKDNTFNGSIQKNSSENLDYSTVETLYDSLRENFDGQLENDKIITGLKEGLISASGDQYTEYLTPDESKDFNEGLSGSFTGIGAELGKDPNGNIQVISPIAGFPAEKSGLKPKDVIAEIDGKSTAGISIGDAVKNIRGEANTEVKLRIIRNSTEDISFTITRAQITIASVKHSVKEGNIGYIQISRFSEDTDRLIKQAAQDLKSQNVKGIVLDLRNNPGGLLESAVTVSSLWLEKNAVVLQEKRDDKIVKTFKAEGSNLLGGVPTIVLINEGSASASEIVAGALSDNKQAKLYGQKTYGKGSVQQLIELSDGGVLKVTIAKWFTPAGVNINKEGIKPDKEVTLSDDDIKNLRDPQLDAALIDLR